METKSLKRTKKNIPQALRKKVWIKCVGEKFTGACYTCGSKITVYDWHCGHVHAEAAGGETHVDNLRPVCSTCNLSMGTQNMEDFKRKHFSRSQPQYVCCAVS